MEAGGKDLILDRCSLKMESTVLLVDLMWVMTGGMIPKFWLDGLEEWS